VAGVEVILLSASENSNKKGQYEIRPNRENSSNKSNEQETKYERLEAEKIKIIPIFSGR
jgi:hypothetical protein